MRFTILFILLSLSLFANISERKLESIYNSIDPNSIDGFVTFHSLYKETELGKKAIDNALRLLRFDKKNSPFNVNSGLSGIESLISKQSFSNEQVILSDDELLLIESIASHLPNRRLKGHYVSNVKDPIKLNETEVDIARALLLTQYEDELDFERKIKSYEAYLDLIALQILAQVNYKASPEDVIETINNFVFNKMHTKFPPQSKYEEDIDKYSDLSNVLDSNRGVCLGVSILYLSIAQRLGLPLEIITPVGHIYVRYNDGKKIINIECTARGVNIPTENYLSINSKSLRKNNLKEVIGLVYVNQGSKYWLEDQDLIKAIKSYESALKFIPGDPLITEFLGYVLLLNNSTFKGKRLLKKALKNPTKNEIYSGALAKDFINKNCDIESLKAIFLKVDSKKESIDKKIRALELTLIKHPEFLEGLFHLSMCYMQMDRVKDALALLIRYHEIESNNPTIEFYLAYLFYNRFDYRKAKKHLLNAEYLTSSQDHFPKDIKQLKKELLRLCP